MARSGKDLDADYKQAGFSGSLPVPTSPALIIVDMCAAYLQPGAPLYAGIEDAHQNCATLLTAFRDAELPVVHTRVEYGAGGADGGLFYQKVPALACFDKGNPLGEWPDDLKARDDEVVITKQYASAFFATSLASTLRAMGVDGLYITGVSTSGCVRATALDCIQSGFIPVVVEDACGDRDQAVHDANIFDLQAKYADLISTQDALARLAE